jgi:hypothetical protein
MQPDEIRIKNRIYGHGRGWCFTPKHFSDLANDGSIRIALVRLEKEGLIRRLTRGVYYYPKDHKQLGILPPNAEDVALALAHRDKIEIQPSGAYAANLLGLSEQVPVRIVFLTNGKSKKIKMANMEIVFKETTPKNISVAKTITGLIIQALRYIKKENVTGDMISKIKNKLSVSDQKILKSNYTVAPTWIARIIKEKLLG